MRPPTQHGPSTRTCGGGVSGVPPGSFPPTSGREEAQPASTARKERTNHDAAGRDDVVTRSMTPAGSEPVNFTLALHRVWRGGHGAPCIYGVGGSLRSARRKPAPGAAHAGGALAELRPESRDPPSLRSRPSAFLPGQKTTVGLCG